MFAVHLVVAIFAKPSFALTMFGDLVPCVLLILALLAMTENFRNLPGILPVFWKVFAGGTAMMLLSQSFWIYYDWRRLDSSPSPVFGDSLFLLAQVFVLSALALRPHSAVAGRDLRLRSLDFVLMSLWWMCLYGYFALPWQILLHDYSHYNPAYYIIALLQHLAIVAAAAVLALRKSGTWQRFYILLTAAFALIAAGNLLLSIAIDNGWYHSGGFCDTPFFLAIYLFAVIACQGNALQPHEDATANRELVQSVWTARAAMLVMLSLPFIALWGLRNQGLPQNVAAFRLRLVFASMFVLGVLVYWKLNLLTRELVRLVHLTRDSIGNLNSVQRKMSQAEKFVALGRLAAGAAHEISNPLTAILGYSELLADIPSLSAEDHGHAQEIREQVHRAQAAVASLRNTMRQSSPSPTLVLDKKSVS
jgi:signal transduction histidine kinase